MSDELPTVVFEPGCVDLGSAIMCGPGGVTVRRRGRCYGCNATGVRMVRVYPNSAYRGTDDYCEQGCYVQDDDYSVSPEHKAERAQRFEVRWDKALPEGTTVGYDDDAWLSDVCLPDGRVVHR